MNFIDKILFEAFIKNKVKSSNIKTVAYDAKEKVLRLTFHDGSTYEYSNVPKRTHTNLLKAKSKGRYAYYNIYWNYDYARLD